MNIVSNFMIKKTKKQKQKGSLYIKKATKMIFGCLERPPLLVWLLVVHIWL